MWGGRGWHIGADVVGQRLPMCSSFPSCNGFRQIRDNGATVVLVTHEHDIAGMAHRVIHLTDGLIESDERTAEAA